MRWYRFLLIPLILGALVPLSRYLNGPALSLAPPALPDIPEPEAPELPKRSTPDAKVTQLLDRAIENLSEERAPWLETKFWQRMRLPELAYEGEAHFQSAPGHRYRLEIRTHMGDLDGNFLTICNGTELWAGSRVGPGEWTVVTRLDLMKIMNMLAGSTICPRLRREFLQGETFTGVTPLLRNLRRQLCWVRAETLSRSAGPELRLTGVWSQEQRAALTDGKPWPASLARQCRLSLDGRSLWPQRIEWWGPRSPGGKDGLLAEMEFRELTINRTMTPKQCARTFRFHAGETKVIDQTKKVSKQLLARNLELLEAEKK
jgi:hypothetical protein